MLQIMIKTLDPALREQVPLNLWYSTTKVMLLFSLPWGKTVPSLEQAVLRQAQCSFLTKQTFLFKSGFSQSSTSLIKETRAKELQLCWLGAIINSKCLCCLFFCQDNINWPQNFWVKSINIELKAPKVSERYFNNHFLTTNWFFFEILKYKLRMPGKNYKVPIILKGRFKLLFRKYWNTNFRMPRKN